MTENLEKSEQEKIEWRKFYQLKDELWKLIANKTAQLDDSSGKLSRWICLTTDEELLKKIEFLSKELNGQYKIASKENKDYRETPTIIRDVENIIINSYDSYSSRTYTEDSPLSKLATITVNTVTSLEDIWGKSYEKNLKKYKLIEDRKRNVVAMGVDDIIELSNAKSIQIRHKTGLRYTLNVRKIGEQVSKRYKYGIVIVNNEDVVINQANKEAKRKHSLDVSGERVEFPFPVNLNCEVFIKEKK